MKTDTRAIELVKKILITEWYETEYLEAQTFVNTEFKD